MVQSKCPSYSVMLLTLVIFCTKIKKATRRYKIYGIRLNEKYEMKHLYKNICQNMQYLQIWYNLHKNMYTYRFSFFIDYNEYLKSILL